MQPDIDGLKNKLEENRDFLARIIEKLPGYKGWGLQDRKERYSVDQMLREFIVLKIQDIKTLLNRLSNDLFTQEKHDLLPVIDSLNNELERLLKKCQHADYTGSAVFSGLKITEDDEYRLLEYDWRLISDIESLSAIFTGLNDKADTPLADQLQSAGEQIRSFEKNFDDRKYIILEVI